MKTAAATLMVVLALLLESPATPGAEPSSMTGMVVAVDMQHRKVQVVTGVGHALRVVEFRAGIECRIVVAGVTAYLQQVRRGAIVEVRYRVAEGINEATAIEARAIEEGNP